MAYIKAVAEEAKQLPAHELELRGNYKDITQTFPQTVGEEFANKISYALAMQDWIDWESDPELEEIGSIAGGFEINTDDHQLWQELFEKVANL